MKLYWRYKKPDGKWTYQRAQTVEHDGPKGYRVVVDWEEEE